MEPAAPYEDTHVLRRPVDRRMVAGVAAGVADYVQVDVVVVRVVLVALAVMGGLGVPLYLAAWLLVPERGSDGSVAEQVFGRVRHETATTWAARPAPTETRSDDVVAS